MQLKSGVKVSRWRRRGGGSAQLLSVLRNSPFSVICREEVLLGDRPLRCDVTA